MEVWMCNATKKERKVFLYLNTLQDFCELKHNDI